jgi:hypothetical protein
MTDRFEFENGKLDEIKPKKSKPFKACSVAGCIGNSHYTAKGRRGWCCSHYRRWQRNGDPLGGTTAPGALLKWVRQHLNYEGEDCLIWPFGKTSGGYGQLNQRIASNFMCEMANGEAPSTKHVAAHSCGNGHLGCMNPKHLRWATRSENEADKIIHGAVRRGCNYRFSKLTEDQARQVLAMGDTVSQKEMALMFNVARTTISSLITRRSWKYLSEGISDGP